MRHDPLLLVVVGLVIVCPLVAALLGRTVWAAAFGAGVVALMWLIESLTMRRAKEGSFGHGMAVGMGGMVLRLGLAIGALAAVGALASREAFVDATLALVASYTIYNGARLWRHPAVTTDRRNDERSGSI